MKPAVVSGMLGATLRRRSRLRPGSPAPTANPPPPPQPPSPTRVTRQGSVAALPIRQLPRM
jgi:hypothetical protein